MINKLKVKKRIVFLLIFFEYKIEVSMIIKKDINEFLAYLTDASNLKGIASSLFIPEDKRDLFQIIDESYNKTIPMTFRAAGTSTTGASVAQSGVIISMEKFNKIIDIDPKNKIAKVEAGVSLAELDTALKEYGLFYPVNPTETNATIGGNIATNASGARTFKYGATVNNISSISAYTFQNKTLNENIYDIDIKYTYTQLKNAVGYNDTCPLIGSEGTLGAITSIDVKLQNIPEKIMAFLIFFDKSKNMLSLINDVKNHSYKSFANENKGLQARLMEYYDSNCLNIIRTKYPSIEVDANHALWIEQEYKEKDEDVLLSNWYKIIEEHSSLAKDTIIALEENKHRELAEIRHSLPEYINETTSKHGIIKTATDTAVYDKDFISHFKFIEKINNQSKIENYTFGHIGNSHLHTNFLPKNSVEIEQAQQYNIDIVKNAIALNGTVSAEHGIGKIKNKYFNMMKCNFNYKKMYNIKEVLDNKNLFGQGNIF